MFDAFVLRLDGVGYLGRQPTEQVRSRVRRGDAATRRRPTPSRSGLGRQPTEQVRSRLNPTPNPMTSESWSSTNRASPITRVESCLVVTARVSVVNQPSKSDHNRRLIILADLQGVSVVNQPSKSDHDLAWWQRLLRLLVSVVNQPSKSDHFETTIGKSDHSCLGRQPTEQVRSHERDEIDRRAADVSVVNQPSKYDHPITSKPRSSIRSSCLVGVSRSSTDRASTIT